jgi:hypothetical protein
MEIDRPGIRHRDITESRPTLETHRPGGIHSLLDNPEGNTEAGHVIHNHAREIPLDPASLPPRVTIPLFITQITRDASDFRALGGLKVSQRYATGEMNIPSVPTGVYVGKMDFLTTLTADASQEELQQILFDGLTDLQEYFSHLDKADKQPEYLVGMTTRRMALATRRLGFEVHDEDPVYVVVGKTDVVRAHLEQKDAKGRTIIDRVRSRLS